MKLKLHCMEDVVREIELDETCYTEMVERACELYRKAYGFEETENKEAVDKEYDELLEKIGMYVLSHGFEDYAILNDWADKFICCIETEDGRTVGDM